MVKEGKITSLQEIFENGYKIKEPEIVQALLPNIKTMLISIRVIQKQTDAGELTRFRALTAVGDLSGWFGVGHAKSLHTRVAIDKAARNALLSVVPVPLGCGAICTQWKEWQRKDRDNSGTTGPWNCCSTPHKKRT